MTNIPSEMTHGSLIIESGLLVIGFKQLFKTTGNHLEFGYTGFGPHILSSYHPYKTLKK